MSSYNVLKESNLPIPTDLYLEGGDQYRGWFNSSLICSVIQNNKAPYKRLLSHGMTLDDQGRKMSKSIGNVIDPLKVCEQFGADILRMWVANSDYQDDVRISNDILDQISEMYRRIRNSIFKFILSNLSDFVYEKDKSTDFDLADVYILNELKQNMNKIIDAYENYNFSIVIKTINLEAIKLSGWYFDVIKDSLYCDEPNNKHRRAIQTVLYTILNFYMLALAPIIPHTCEEVYTHSNISNKKDSIFLTEMIKDIDFDLPKVDLAWWKQFFSIKDKVFTALEQLRKDDLIAKNTQASVIIKMNSNPNSFSPEILKKYLNVAKCEILIDSNIKDIEVSCSNANYVRCERCWNYYPAGSINGEHICKRCEEILSKKS